MMRIWYRLILITALVGVVFLAGPRVVNCPPSTSPSSPHLLGEGRGRCPLVLQAQAPTPASAVDAIIVLDTTGSMRGGGGAKNIWDRVLATVRSLMDALPDGTRLAVVPFDRGPRLDRAFPPLAAGVTDLQPVALDAQARAALKDYLDALPADGNATWIYESVEFALNRLRAWQAADPDHPHRPSLFVYTDGLDNGPHSDDDMSGLASLYQNARTDLPVLYGFYGDVGEQLGAAARQKLTEAGYEVTSGIPARTVSVVTSALDFGELITGGEVTRTVRFESRTPTVWGTTIRLRLDSTAPVSLTQESFALHEEVVVGLRPIDMLQPGVHQARLLLSTESGVMSINPPVIEILFQGAAPTATPSPLPSPTSVPVTPTPTLRPLPPTPAPTTMPTIDISRPALVVAVGSNERLPLLLGSYDLSVGDLPAGTLVVTRALNLDWRVDRQSPTAGLTARIDLDRANPVNLSIPDAAYLQGMGPGVESPPSGSLSLKPDTQALVIGLAVSRSQLEGLGYGDHPIKGTIVLQAVETEVRGSVSPQPEASVYEVPFILSVRRSWPMVLWVSIGAALLILGGGVGVPVYVRYGIKRFAPGLWLSLDGKTLGKSDLAQWQNQGHRFPRSRLTIGNFQDQVDLGWGKEYSGLAELFADGQGRPWVRHRGRPGIHIYVRDQELRPGQAVRLAQREPVRITSDEVQIVTEHILMVVGPQ